MSRVPADPSLSAPRPRLRHIALGWLALLSAAGLGGAARAAQDVGPRPPGQFDYYVLSLSWVPGFCATNTKDPNECQKGLTFALHGLWPQFEGGRYPTNTSGGHLSESYMQGWALNLEAVQQVRGLCAERQVKDCAFAHYMAAAPVVTSIIYGKEPS